MQSLKALRIPWLFLDFKKYCKSPLGTHIGVKITKKKRRAKNRKLHGIKVRRVSVQQWVCLKQFLTWNLKLLDITLLNLEFKKLCRASMGAPIAFEITQNKQELKKIWGLKISKGHFHLFLIISWFGQLAFFMDLVRLKICKFCWKWEIQHEIF